MLRENCLQRGMVKKGHGEGVDKPVHSMMKTIDYACFKLKAVKNKNNFINFMGDKFAMSISEER